MTNINYDFNKIEENWREKWFEDNIYKAVDFSEKPKQYILAELPYPSGKFLHVGHMMRYTVPEIYSRFLRMKGYNVLFPMGWDCFGLPAETYAIKQGITPQEAIAIATKNYKEAMQKMGYGIDWDREIYTSDPEYYKWTQWMFIKLWEKGLAELQEMPVWWCEQLGVLADEEVLPAKEGNGKVSERGGYPVEKKMFKQWVLKIPEYADRLLDDLNKVDYYDSVKVGQANWIGKKTGALVDFEIKGKKVTAFTTRPDTLFGVTFLAISPEHDLVDELVAAAENKDEVLAYIEKSKNLSDMERQTKEKTGIAVKGIYAKHPFKEIEREIPVFIADYILVDFGTGVVMGVPGHDERDFEFAQKYNCEIIEVVSKRSRDEATSQDNSHKENSLQKVEDVFTGEGTMINSAEYNGMKSSEFKTAAIERLQKEQKGKPHKTYKVRPQIFSRQRYWGEPIPLVNKADGTIEAAQDLPVELPIMKDFMAGEDGISPLEKNNEWNQTTDSQGNAAKRETDTMPTWAGSNWYYIRYIDPKNKENFADMEKLKYWMPVDKYFGDAGHTTAHLLYSRFWYKALYDMGYLPDDEPYKWRMSGGMLLGPDHQKMSKSKGNVVNPQEVIEKYGADAVRTYLAFLGPYEDTYPWNENGLIACFKLVRNIYGMQDKVVDVDFDFVSATITELEAHSNAAQHKETAQNFYKLVKHATQMLTDLKMNTAVSEIMIFTNHLKKQKQIPSQIWKEFIKVLAPFAPFAAEELWQKAHNYTEWQAANSVHLQPWPELNKELAKDQEITIPVQVNGKVRDNINISPNLSEEKVKELALSSEIVQNYTEGKDIKRFIYVPNKIVNIVV